MSNSKINGRKRITTVMFQGERVAQGSHNRCVRIARQVSGGNVLYGQSWVGSHDYMSGEFAVVGSAFKHPNTDDEV